MASKNDSRDSVQDVVVLTATTGDIPCVREMLFSIIDEIDIYNEAAKEYERHLYTLEYLHSLTTSDPSSILIAKRGTSAWGFLITKSDNGPIWLCWFGVAHSQRGKGIGSLLIGKMLEFAVARGIHKIWCDTRTSNQYSISILTSFGFERMCRLDNHWCHQDYFLWQKFIGDPNKQRQMD